MIAILLVTTGIQAHPALRRLDAALPLGRALALVAASRRQVLQAALQLHVQMQPPRVGRDAEHRDVRPRDVEAHRGGVVVRERARGAKRRERELGRRKHAVDALVVLLHGADLPREVHAHGVGTRVQDGRLELERGHHGSTVSRVAFGCVRSYTRAGCGAGFGIQSRLKTRKI